MKKITTLIVFVLFIAATGHASGISGSETDNGKYRLLIKFCPEYVYDVVDGELFLSPMKTIKAWELVILSDHRYRQVMQYSEEERQQMRTGTYLLPRGKNSFNIYKFRGMVYLEGTENLSLKEINEIAAVFETLPFVEYTAIEPAIPPPPPTNTPDFSHLQDYRHGDIGNNIVGIDIDYAWSIGVKGEGIGIADIEWGFNFNHEDLQQDSFINLLPTTNPEYNEHGTAVAGVMYAIENDYGMTGMVHQADVFYGISELPFGRVYGIAIGIDSLNEGDVFLYEMQTGGQYGNYVPADFNMAVWDITLQASNAGIIVVAAAGNGAENLDNPFYDEYNARGDNGSIIVGAGTRVGRNKASFSTYGSRVNLQGWGDWSVATTGYGALYNGGPNATYTDGFSGTSAATPIVASAVVAVQSYAKSELGILLTPQEMRSLLIDTGTSQGEGWGEGNLVPQPNVREAIIELYNTHAGVANPESFTATAGYSDRIDLSWTKNQDNHDVMLVWSDDNVFGSPEEGQEYQAGQNIPGGGIILYTGDSTAYAHTGLEPATMNFYKAYSYSSSLIYSFGKEAQAKTLCESVTQFPFLEKFDTASHLPDCWEIYDHIGYGQVWEFGTHDYGLTGTSGNYAYLLSLNFGSAQSQNTDLISPVFDFSEYEAVTIGFTHYFRQRQNRTTGGFYYSTDLGETWVKIEQWTETTPNPDFFYVELSEPAAESQVRFKWNYTGTFGFFWDIDDIEITGINVPLQPSVITGMAEPCAGSGQHYSVNHVEGVEYDWDLPADWVITSGGQTHSITVNVGADSGEVRVTPWNTYGSGMSRTLDVFPIQIPVIGGVNGPVYLCAGDTVMYDVEALPDVYYSWAFPEGWQIIEGASGHEVSVIAGTMSGIIVLTPANQCGEGEDVMLEVFTENSPAITAIAGNQTVCEGSVETYRVDSIPGALYSWILPGDWLIGSDYNGHEVMVTPGQESGWVKVWAKANCDPSDTVSLYVEASPRPPTPSITMNDHILYSDAPEGNQWYYQDGMINGATSQEFTPLENGIYHVVVTLNNCSSDTSNTIEVLDISVPELHMANRIKVYPNPVANRMTIEYPGNHKPIGFEVYNTDGNLVFNGRFIEKTTIETGNLPAGIYLIRFENGSEIEVKKVIRH
jgi:subtilisin family serine protease